MNFLATSSGFLGYGVRSVSSIPLDWIGNIVKALIGSVGLAGAAVGIIVFTIIIKSIVLPLDIYSRIKMKKQALVMEKMRPQMEKLQKQYANDKQLYQQKVVELQKKSGYSVFGACLPMLVTIVIFFIVFGAFSTYSQYANLESYNGMVNAYNGTVESYVINDDGGFLEKYGRRKTDDCWELYVPHLDEEGEKIDDYDYYKDIDYKVNYEKFAAFYNAKQGEKAAAENGTWTDKDEEGVFDALMASYKEAYGDDALFENVQNKHVDGDKTKPLTEAADGVRRALVSFYIEDFAAEAAKDYYLQNKNGFLWVGNIWYPDSMFEKEIPDFGKFKSSVSRANISDDYADSYNKVTAHLGTQKNTYNGYFVLIVLSIGFMLLQQFISMRANKSVNELGTVDGSGARTNKWMMILMPIIFGIFSFMYSTSFSLYMITSTVFGIVTTVVINKIMDIWFAKKADSFELEEKSSRKRGKK